MTRTRIAIAFAGSLLAALVAVPATASALPTTDQVLANLAEAPEIQWHTMTPVADFFGESEPQIPQSGDFGKPAPAPLTQVPAITKDSPKKWSTAHLDAVCRAALAYYEVPESEWAWVIAANRNVAYRESGNRPGAISGTGTFQGMHQWSPDWADTERLDGNWSVTRFVKVYAVGGKAKIRQHWKATLGGL